MDSDTLKMSDLILVCLLFVCLFITQAKKITVHTVLRSLGHTQYITGFQRVPCPKIIK